MKSIEARGIARIGRVLAVAAIVAATATSGILLQPSAAQAASTTYYVDAVSGSDSAAGTSQTAAWRTLARINAATFQPGDRILLRGGQAWTGSVRITSSGTAAAPIVLGAFGTGRPRIDANTSATNAVSVVDARYVTVQGLEVTNTSAFDTSTTSIYRGISVEASDIGEVQGIRIVGNHVHHVDGQGRSGGIGNGGIVVGVRGNTTPTWFSGLRITGNEVGDIRAYGISTFTTWCAGCVIYSDETGIPTSEVASSRQAFTGLVIDQNHVHDVTGGGITPQYADGALVERNTVDRAASDQLLAGGGNVGIWWQGTNDIVVQYNTVRRTGFGGIYANADAQAFDADMGSRNSLVQYNISESNGGGFFMCLIGSFDSHVRYNISFDDRRSLIQNLDGCSDTRVTNNTLWTTTSQTQTRTAPGVAGPSQPLDAIVQADASRIVLANNVIHNPQGAPLVGNRVGSAPADVQWSHNAYWNGTASGPVAANDPAPVTTAPSLTNPSSSLPANGFIAPATFSAYVARFAPTSTAPVLDRGITTFGTSRDVAGTRLPVGAVDLGAIQHAVGATATTNLGTAEGAVANLVDGDLGTSWASASFPASGGSVDVAYGSARTLDTVTLAGRFGQGQGPTSVTVQTWDGSSWVTRLANQAITWRSSSTVDEFQRLVLPAAVTTTRLRVVIHSANTTWGHVAMNEIGASYRGSALTDMGESSGSVNVQGIVDVATPTAWVSRVPFTPGLLVIDGPAVTATSITLQANFAQGQAPTRIEVRARNGVTGTMQTVLASSALTWTTNSTTVESVTVRFPTPVTATTFEVRIVASNSTWSGSALSGITVR